MNRQETFILRLRRHRERNQISLEDIAKETRIKRELLEAFERNDLSGWPRGLYARSWIRAYVIAIGFDPIETVDEFCRHFPHGDRRAQPTLEQIAGIVASPSDGHDPFDPLQPARRAGDAARQPPPTWFTVLLLALRELPAVGVVQTLRSLRTTRTL